MRPQLFNIDTALLTSNCVVRRFRENEGGVFRNLIEQNKDYLQDHFPILVAEVGADDDSAECFLRERIAAWLLQQDYAFGIWHNESTELIGYVHIFDINWEVPMAEISYFIDKDHMKQGLMTEVLARVLRFVFRQLELEKIYLKTLSDNFASQRLARRVGFSREGDLRNEFRKPGGMIADLVRFGFSRETYGE
ncbi:GNAT family N-acetyltransferase [Neolewinella agarilytica]|uniref:Ribosomal-protein-serine acetyltransferase n=1 Tax=Neolewinella agarilytica TaxID=478744 RepID=A0A1H8ZGP7_9BACT|nr:GNAT family N-acetyltransferase [Neolewinella agarilytica]SEP63521.1 ribosomal-protein-serine acetyltransferase [Neolewinella agarilytica]